MLFVFIVLFTFLFINDNVEGGSSGFTFFGKSNNNNNNKVDDNSSKQASYDSKRSMWSLGKGSIETKKLKNSSNGSSSRAINNGGVITKTKNKNKNKTNKNNYNSSNKAMISPDSSASSSSKTNGAPSSSTSKSYAYDTFISDDKLIKSSLSSPLSSSLSSSSYQTYKNKNDVNNNYDYFNSHKGSSSNSHSPIDSKGRYRPKNSDIYKVPKWFERFPRISLMIDPVVNFKIRQRIQKFGTGITLGCDYLSDVAHWRMYCVVEDYVVGGRFSLRGSELGWTKSWLWSLGMGETEENGAKFKLRLGLNLKTLKAYARLRFRTEPISPFGLDVGEGITCVGKLPLPAGGLVPVIRHVPLRIEYRLRVNTPRDLSRSGLFRRRKLFGGSSSGRNKLSGVDLDQTPDVPIENNDDGGNIDDNHSNILESNRDHSNKDKRTNPSRYDNTLSFSTGIDAIELSVDELNFCLEFDEQSSMWDIGLLTQRRKKQKPVIKKPSAFIPKQVGRSRSYGGLGSNSGGTSVRSSVSPSLPATIATSSFTSVPGVIVSYAGN